MTPASARLSGPLTGTASVPGDKSVSHRALMLGALAIGETRITGLLEGHDVLATAAAMRGLGATVTSPSKAGTSDKARIWTVHGVGVGGLMEPDRVLDMGNSGTSTRLISGLLATHPITAFLTGDSSLCRRPMNRITDPLAAMGARFVTRNGGRLPMAIQGSGDGLAITYRLPVASAQVKSAILLAGLNALGETTVIEPVPTRDHSELMLRHFGADVSTSDTDEGEAITVAGEADLRACTVDVPGDISSAAFLVVAALICPSSELVVENVGMNPRRTGLIDTLLEMGAAITLENRRHQAGETVADLRVRHGELHGVEVPAARAASMIDEYPVLAMAAACAEGRTVMRGLAELRVKESDRLAAVVRGLTACGVTTEVENDDLIVHGQPGGPPGGGHLATDLDHRIAMSFLVLGLATKQAVTIDDADPIETSFPGFAALMNRLCRARGSDEPAIGRPTP